jgi:hypothetical protein
MKFSFVFIFVFTVVNASRSQDCKSYNFPYKYTSGVVRCTHTPYITGKESGGGAIPWHIAKGSDIFFCVDPSVGSDPSSGGLASSGCMDASALDACVNSALNTWLALCPDLDVVKVDETDGSPCGGGLYTISGSTDVDNDFPTGSDADGADAETSRIVSSNGVINTDQCSTKLNFTGQVEAEKGQTITTCPVPSGCNDAGLVDVNACCVMKHEIGHLFGLQDLMNDPGPCSGGCSSSSDVMWGDLPPGYQSCDNCSLSACDECYFEGLYCNEDDGVKGGQSQGTGTLELSPGYPSPFLAQAQATLTLSQFAYVHASLYDVLGNLVANVYASYTQAGNTLLDVDGSKLAPGTYFLRVNTNSAIATIRMVRGQ